MLSHWLSCGHTRPQTSRKCRGLCRLLDKLPQYYLLLLLTNKSWNIDRYRTALNTSCILTVEAALLPLPLLLLCYIHRHTSSKFVALTFGSCSLTGTLFNTFAIICHLRSFRIHRDGCHLPVISALHDLLLSCTSAVSS